MPKGWEKEQEERRGEGKGEVAFQLGKSPTQQARR